VLRYEINAMRGRSTVVAFSDGVLINAYKGGNSSSRAVFARLPDWPEMAVWKAWLRPSDTFLDVGANAGLYTLVAAEVGAHVVAVEPADAMVRLLTENVRLNDFKDVTIHQVALMDREGTVDLHGPDANRQVASLRAVDGGIAATTVDELVGGQLVRGIKMDVEGNERLVIEGSTRLLADGRVDLIQLEWNDASEAALGEDRAPLASLLSDAGFSLFQFSEDAELMRSDSSVTPPLGRDVFAARGEAVRFLTGYPWGSASTEP
jgi:FkbM family methyltransferase